MTQAAYATQTVFALVQDALQRNASGIQLSCRGDKFEIRYCIEGLVILQVRYANDEVRVFADAACSFLEGPHPHDISQCLDGQVRMPLPSGDSIQLRIVRFPCLPDGFDLLIKFRAPEERPTLKDLGYTAHHFETISRAVDEALKNGQDSASTAEIAGPVGRL